MMTIAVPLWRAPAARVLSWRRTGNGDGNMKGKLITVLVGVFIALASWAPLWIIMARDRYAMPVALGLLTFAVSFVGVVVALAMRDRHPNDLACIIAARERRIRPFDPQVNVVADELQLRVAHEHAGQKACFAQDLKAVADAEHETAVAGERTHRVHH